MEESLRNIKPPTTSQSEKELILAAQNDPKKFEPLYNKYYRQIFLFVFHRVMDKELTADIVSQVFFKALTKIKNYVYMGHPLSSWLYKIAINETNEHFRKKKTRRNVLLDEQHVQLLSEELYLHEEDELQLKLKSAFQQLKPSELQLIELRFFESLSFKEIGTIVGITDNNAKVKVYRILDKMRKKITR